MPRGILALTRDHQSQRSPFFVSASRFLTSTLFASTPRFLHSKPLFRTLLTRSADVTASPGVQHQWQDVPVTDVTITQNGNAPPQGAVAGNSTAAAAPAPAGNSTAAPAAAAAGKAAKAKSNKATLTVAQKAAKKAAAATAAGAAAAGSATAAGAPAPAAAAPAAAPGSRAARAAHVAVEAA
ncbi:hypothetical protein C8R45DRAFT_1076407 [Mycena sanguinolenta]|nr:hypothetical protein C8R45DRAFT_1076407 [Mycena sanguinolenta]